MQTLVLWGLPGIALIVGVGAAMRLFRRRKEAVESPEDEFSDNSETLSVSEHEELDRILAGKPRT